MADIEENVFFGVFVMLLVLYIMICISIGIFVSYNSEFFEDDESTRSILYWMIVIESALGIMLCFVSGIVRAFQADTSKNNSYMLVFYMVWLILTYLLQVFPGYSKENVCGGVTNKHLENDRHKDWKLQIHDGEKIDVWRQYYKLKHDVDKMKNEFKDGVLSVDCTGDKSELCKDYVRAVGKCTLSDKDGFSVLFGDKHCSGIKGIYQNLPVKDNETSVPVELEKPKIELSSLFSKSLMTHLYNIELNSGSVRNIGIMKFAMLAHNFLIVIALLGFLGLYTKIAVFFKENPISKLVEGVDKVTTVLERSSTDTDKARTFLKGEVAKQTNQNQNAYLKTKITEIQKDIITPARPATL